MPGEGHMVHMPAHIYIRVGRWNDAIQTNRHAIHSDEVFIEEQHPMGVYPLAYYPHNIHFLAFASMMAGRSVQAIDAGDTLTSKVNLDAARQVGMLQEMLPYYALTLTTLGKWDEVLAAPLPPEDIRFSYAMAHYVCGVAHAAKSEWAKAVRRPAVLRIVVLRLWSIVHSQRLTKAKTRCPCTLRDEIDQAAVRV